MQEGSWLCGASRLGVVGTREGGLELAGSHSQTHCEVGMGSVDLAKGPTLTLTLTLTLTQGPNPDPNPRAQLEPEMNVDQDRVWSRDR